MSCNEVLIQPILGSECIGDSLPKINDNFSVLETAACRLYTKVDEVSAAIGTAAGAHGNHTGAITSSGLATSYNLVVPSDKGGAGSVSGIMKANGSGNVSAAAAGTDYVAPSELANYALATSVSNKIDNPSTKSNAQVLTYNQATDKWIAADPPSGGGGGGTGENLTGDVTSIGSATTYNNVVPASKGGAGTVNGILKANGSGTVSQAVAGTDYATVAQVNAKISNPSPKSAGQVLTYNGSAWVASAPAGSNVPSYIFDPCKKFASLGLALYSFDWLTDKGMYSKGRVRRAGAATNWLQRPLKISFFDRYLEKNPGVVPVKGYSAWHDRIVLLSDGTIWAQGAVSRWFFGETGGNTWALDFMCLNVGALQGKVVTDFTCNDSWEAFEVLTLGVVCDDGTGYLVGYNGFGQLGNGNTTSSKVWVQVTIPGKTIAQVSVGGKYATVGTNTLVRTTDGAVYAAGWNSTGSLGDGTTAQKNTFVQCKQNASTFLTDVEEILNYHVVNVGYTRFVKKTDGTLWGCGLNNIGQIGDGTTTQRNFFTKTNNITDLKKLTGNGYSTGTSMCALTNDGKVYTWGTNAYGETGLGLVGTQSSPQQVTVYQNGLNVADTAELPPIVDVSGSTSLNNGAFGLISADKELYIAGTYTYMPFSSMKGGYDHTTLFKRFEKRNDISNVEEVMFYCNSTDGGYYTVGCVAKDSSGVLWGYGNDQYGILGTVPDGASYNVLLNFVPLNLYS